MTFRKTISLLLLAALAACQLPAAPTPVVQVPYVPPAEASLAPAATATVPAASETAGPTPTAEDPIVFAAFGDYGQAGPEIFKLAEMVDSWSVGFIVTLGDNNYQDGSAETIDTNIGQYFHRYIGNYQGDFNRGSPENRFFPSLGNHDWNRQAGYEPYLDYFSLPGNERYYNVDFGIVHLFILNSDDHEPDGVGQSSTQAEWFRETIAQSTAEWNVVAFHHAPYSSGSHGPTNWMQWPFKEWGADVVLAGHEHLYERLLVNDLLYITNGLGGHNAVYAFENIVPESQFRYNGSHGSLRITATSQSLFIEFININGELVDSVTLSAD